MSNSIIIMHTGLHAAAQCQGIIRKIWVLLPNGPISHRLFTFLLRPSSRLAFTHIHNLLVDSKVCPRKPKPLPFQTELLEYQNQKQANLALPVQVPPHLFPLPRWRSDKKLQPLLLLVKGDPTRQLMMPSKRTSRRKSMLFRSSLYVDSTLMI